MFAFLQITFISVPVKSSLSPGSLSDQELLKLIRKDDRAAFTELYNRYWDKIFVVAANRLKDDDIAGEIVQDIFLSVWLRRASLQITHGLAAYLSVAVKYKVIDHLSSQHKRQQLLDGLAIRSLTFEDSTNELLATKELHMQLQESIHRLPPKCRIVFLMSREDDKTYAEIAAELGIAEKTVEAHMSKALNILRQTLKISVPLLFYLLLKK